MFGDDLESRDIEKFLHILKRYGDSGFIIKIEQNVHIGYKLGKFVNHVANTIQHPSMSRQEIWA